MKKNLLLLLISSSLLFCKSPSSLSPTLPKEVTEQLQIQTFPTNCSIRAITAIDKSTLWYGGSKGQFGYTEDGGNTWTIDSIQHTKKANLEFRGIAKTNKAIFLLAIESPALLFKSIDKGKNWTVVYEENHPTAFYDAIAFWDDQTGIAMGDPTDGCLSIILTNDGGNTWIKIPCDQLPATEEGEAAFAASNSNIALVDNHVWIVSGGKRARIFHSPDKGKTWEVFDTPIVQGEQMTGIFTVNFYDKNNGIIFGGDWENQGQNTNNKAITKDGGLTWQLIADGQYPGYRSAVKYVPNSKGQSIFATGIPGISYSADGGQHWTSLSKTSFYTIQICTDDQTIWLAGRNKIGKMTW